MRIHLVLLIAGTLLFPAVAIRSAWDHPDTGTRTGEEDDTPPISAMRICPVSVYFYNELIDTPDIPWRCCFVPVHWSATDGPGGSGVECYDVQTRTWHPDPDGRDDEVPEWEDWLMGTSGTGAEFIVGHGIHVYEFRCRAVDAAGNAEPWPEACDAFTIGCGIRLPLLWMEAANALNCMAEELTGSIYGSLDLRPIMPPGNMQKRVRNAIDGFRIGLPPIADAGEDQSAYIDMMPGNDPGSANRDSDRLPTMLFNGSASYDTDGTIKQYLWDFGDGKSGKGATVEHTYRRPGNYTVELTVVDDFGRYDNDTANCKISTVF